MSNATLSHLARRALLRTVLENPDDDLPRLILADWLDEAGESDRAAFVRVQCELARWKDGEHCPTCGLHWRFGQSRVDGGPGQLYHCVNNHQWNEADFATLQRREGELLTPLNRTNWGWLCPTDHSREVFRRGFPCELSLPWDDWRRYADQILAATPIRRVDRAPRRTCPHCVATGQRPIYRQYIPPLTCDTCRGAGTLPAETPDWRGDGIVRLARGTELFDANDYRLGYSHPDYPGVHFELPG